MVTDFKDRKAWGKPGIFCFSFIVSQVQGHWVMTQVLYNIAQKPLIFGHGHILRNDDSSNEKS